MKLDTVALRAAADWLAKAPPNTPEWHAKHTIRIYLKNVPPGTLQQHAAEQIKASRSQTR